MSSNVQKKILLGYSTYDLFLLTNLKKNLFPFYEQIYILIKINKGLKISNIYCRLIIIKTDLFSLNALPKLY